MKPQKLIKIYNESIDKAEICLGISSKDLNSHTDESRQIISFVFKELTDVFCAMEINKIDFHCYSYLYENKNYKLIKILDVLNMFE